MLEFLANYGLFLAKSLTLIVLIIGGLLMLIVAGKGGKERKEGHLEVRHMNEWLDEMKDSLKHEIWDKQLLKKELKEKKKEEKRKAKESKKADPEETVEKGRIYVLDFDGDIKASGVEHLREEITAILTLVNPEKDEVMLRLESPGGMVHGYGLAASQLERIRSAGVRLTVCVDKVAASGGYMMACIADRIIAAPFAVMGSIGVVAQVPNIHRLLKKNDVDVEILTAGEYKRTLTMLGENTDKAREKFKHDLEETHTLFKDMVSSYRTEMDIAKVATGEVWYGKQAIDIGMVDELMTSDQWIMQACERADVYWMHYAARKGLQERIGNIFGAISTQTLDKVDQWLNSSRFHR
ncbi:protease SohB [Pokkaliibacter sp. CJK22405]|uniref:protease SohB n=1 Tax=Pokkaliibacter sp. CJK22405 TaxID=3384615 RepID=UPI003984F0E4